MAGFRKSPKVEKAEHLEIQTRFEFVSPHPSQFNFSSCRQNTKKPHFLSEESSSMG